MSRNQSPDWDGLCKWAGVRSSWDLIEALRERVSRMYFWGPPGVGKSYAALRARSAVQITLSGDLTVQELVGMYVPEGAVFKWHDGPIAIAMRAGGLLVINEIGRASDAVRDMLLAVLDDPAVASLALPSGGDLRPAPGFCVVATANTPPEELDPALRSRFEIEIHLHVPNPALVACLNECVRGLGDALLDSFTDPDRALDPRKLLTLGRLVRRGVRPRQAAFAVFGLRGPDVIAALSASGVRL
jgi:MoxR-like ATPase